MKVIAVIPARYASTRFPGKPLALLDGKPIIQHVFQRVTGCDFFDAVIVATDDQRIFDTVKNFGGEAVFTRTSHPSGSDRIAEVVQDMEVDVVVNVQGDEPFIATQPLKELVAVFADPAVDIASLMHPIHDNVANPNAVKVVCDCDGNALYFSRAAIPFDRDATGSAAYFKHIGVYAYRKDVLLAFTRLAPTPLERWEKLEQLRLLEHGYRIRMIKTAYTAIGIDTPQDLAAAEEYIKKGRN